MSNATLSVSLLRGVAQTPRGPVSLTRRDVELLTLLGEGRRCVASGRLADLLWPDADAADAENRLHVAVHRLRRRLGDAGCIRRERFGYRLGAHVACDLPEIASTVALAQRRPAATRGDGEALAAVAERLAGAPLRGNGGASLVLAALEAQIAELRSTIETMTGRPAHGSPVAALLAS